MGRKLSLETRFLILFTDLVKASLFYNENISVYRALCLFRFTLNRNGISFRSARRKQKLLNANYHHNFQLNIEAHFFTSQSEKANANTKDGNHHHYELKEGFHSTTEFSLFREGLTVPAGSDSKANPVASKL